MGYFHLRTPGGEAIFKYGKQYSGDLGRFSDVQLLRDNDAYWVLKREHCDASTQVSELVEIEEVNGAATTPVLRL